MAREKEMEMTYTIEDIKRLVPEEAPQKYLLDNLRLKEPMSIIDRSLLSTRASLEVAVEALKQVASYGPYTLGIRGIGEVALEKIGSME